MCINFIWFQFFPLFIASLQFQYISTTSNNGSNIPICYIPRNCSHKANMVCMGWDCVCKQGLIKDHLLGRCVKAIGRKCNLKSAAIDGTSGNGTSSNEATIHIDIGRQIEDEFIPCASNAYCDPITKTCTCNNGTIHSAPTNHGICHQNYGQYCNKSKHNLLCNPYKHFKCDLLTMKCGCANNGQIYDEIQDSCVAKAGSSYCDFKEFMGIQLKCVQNAVCEISEDYLDQKNDYIIGKCKCTNGFIDVKGICMPSYGSKCSLETADTNTSIRSELICAPNNNLTCKPNITASASAAASAGNGSKTIMGTCECAPGFVLAQHYSETYATTTTKANQSDNYEYNVSSPTSFVGVCKRILFESDSCKSQDVCTANSECKIIAPYYYNYYVKRAVVTTCQCLPGFSPTPKPKSTCKYNYQHSCKIISQDYDNDEEEEDECNEYLGLLCVNGKCQCSAGFLVGKKTEFNGTHCVLLEGEVCKGNGNSSTSKLRMSIIDTDEYYYCINNAFCNVITSKCECNESFGKDKYLNDGKCYPKIPGAICNESNNPCLESTGLICHKHVCICNSSTGNATRKIRHGWRFYNKSSSIAGTTEDVSETDELLSTTKVEFDLSTGKCNERILIKNHHHHHYYNKTVFSSSSSSSSSIATTAQLSWNLCLILFSWHLTIFHIILLVSYLY